MKMERAKEKRNGDQDRKRSSESAMGDEANPAGKLRLEGPPRTGDGIADDAYIIWGTEALCFSIECLGGTVTEGCLSAD